MISHKDFPTNYFVHRKLNPLDIRYIDEWASHIVFIDYGRTSNRSSGTFLYEEFQRIDQDKLLAALTPKDIDKVLPLIKHDNKLRLRVLREVYGINIEEGGFYDITHIDFQKTWSEDDLVPEL